MQCKAQIIFHQLDHSDAVASAIQEKIDDLEKCFSQLISARVWVGSSSQRHRQGPQFQVRIRITLPGAQIIVGQEPGESRGQKDLQSAINIAFHSAKRQLEDYVRTHFRGTRHRRNHLALDDLVIPPALGGDQFSAEAH